MALAKPLPPKPNAMMLLLLHGPRAATLRAGAPRRATTTSFKRGPSAGDRTTPVSRRASHYAPGSSPRAVALARAAAAPGRASRRASRRRSCARAGRGVSPAPRARAEAARRARCVACTALAPLRRTAAPMQPLACRAGLQRPLLTHAGATERPPRTGSRLRGRARRRRQAARQRAARVVRAGSDRV